MRKIKLSILILTTFILSTALLAQTDVFKRSAVIPVPAIENGGFGNIVSGVDFDGDTKMEIYAVNDNWSDAGEELIPRIYKYEWNDATSTWDSVWSAVLDLPAQNTWPPLEYGDWDDDGKMEIIWGPVNNFSDGNTNPSRIVVFEANGDDVLGIASGENFLPNAEWTILPDTSNSENMRPFRSYFGDVDNDGTSEFVFSDRVANLNFGVISVDDIPDNGDGSETWTLEVSGIDSLNVKGVDTTAVFEGGSSWQDLAVVDSTIYILPTDGSVHGIAYANGVWEYLPPQAGVLAQSWSWRNAQVADIDEDGTKEVISGTFLSGQNAEVTLWNVNTEGVWDSGTVIASFSDLGAGRLTGSAQGDIDNDGNIDFVFGSRSDPNPNNGVYRLAYLGGDITSSASYGTSRIDDLIRPSGGQLELLNIANLDADAELEVVYTGIPRGGTLLPIVILDYMQVTETITDIATVRIDADTSYSPDNDGSTFSVLGTVSSVNFTASSDRFSYYIQDGTGGINITKGDETGGGTVYDIGDRLLVTGTVGQFAGTTQLDITTLATDVTLIDSGRIVKVTALTIEDFLAGPEMYEGMLISLSGVAPTADSEAWPVADADENMTIWEGNPDVSMTLRVDKDTDLDDNVAPTYPLNVVGVATQFTFDDPANNGYQITPNFYSDLEQGVTVGPSPYFALVSPADGAVVEITDSSATFDITWNAAVDFNDDIIGYQFVILPEVFDKQSIQTTVTINATDILGLMGDLDTLTAEWTVLVLDQTTLSATSMDTFTVTFINGIIVGVDELNVPNKFYVDQNYPNPFNPTTTIKFGLPTQGVVDLRIYDILGREVVTLVNNKALKAGTHTYEFNASNIASGTYIYRLTTDNNVVTKKMLLLK